ncbi:DUF2945 domain-containing protein [Marivita sp.]|uniref:DUF2945 domain-containing protein n=1 Tax=Marivita sp. TaxID=2003365 RepID=UPI003F6D7834
MAFREGNMVAWNWGNGTGKGEVKKVYTEKTTVKIKGTDVTRDATDDAPAYLIEQDDGDQVLKSDSEVSAA